MNLAVLVMGDRGTVTQFEAASEPSTSVSPTLVPEALRILPVAVVLLFLLPDSAMAQSLAPDLESRAMYWGEYFGMLAIGWGVGVTGWLVTGHQAVSCLFVDMPRAWKLRQKRVLTSSLPIYKYLIGGGLLLLLGTLLIDHLWGIWTQAFDFGVMAGVVVGTWYSFVNARRFRSQVDFLEANQRFLNEKKVALFTELERP